MSEDFKPYISADRSVKELTPVPIIVGVLLGIVFGASSLYLALKVGMTVSASIPIAVLSITLFKWFSKAFRARQATILENNIVQTTGSAGESIAFGVAVTMPALMILGYPMEANRIMLVASLGGLLGILMMIPLRYALIVKGHKDLPYPEGTACAEVLKVGERGGTSAVTVFTGFFVGLIYKFGNVAMKLWSDTYEKAISWFRGATVASEVSPELLGVGFIIGPRIASIMVAGGVLSSFVLIPAIYLFGDGLSTPLFPATKLISQMATHEIWKNYVLYIGAGAVAAGGIISLLQSLPTIVSSAGAAFGSLKKSGLSGKGMKRTERDIPMPIVLGGALLLIILILMSPTLKMNLIGAILIILAGFLFVTVSSRLTGTIGSSSNPISGMTVATLLITSLVFLLLGWTELDYRVTALCVAGIVCVAASNGGTTSQDLKTGHLVGATPFNQQIAILIGALTSAIVIGYTLNELNDASTIWSKKQVPQGAVVSSLDGLNAREFPSREHVGGEYGKEDGNEYRVIQFFEPAKLASTTLPAGRYLVGDMGDVKYFVDPGINGSLKFRDKEQEKIDAAVAGGKSREDAEKEATAVPKYEAPKARLMSMIIDGILSQKLPWGLVLLGVAIAILMELCGVASLPFAVGVYLPLSASMPIFVGGFVRWLVDLVVTRKRRKSMSEEESSSSPGVLYSSGLIAGGSIAGILIAILSVNEEVAQKLDYSSIAPNVTSSMWTPLIAFLLLCWTLYSVATAKPKRSS